MQKDGDTSEATSLSLARGLSVQATVLAAMGEDGSLEKLRAALERIAPLTAKPDASLAVRTVESELHDRLGYMQQFQTDTSEAIPNLQKAMDIAAKAGALDLSNMRAAETYVDAASWIVQTGAFGGQHEVAQKAGAEGNALAQKILAQRPGNKRAIISQAVIATNLTAIDMDAMRPQAALEKSHRAVELQQILVSMDPGNTIAHNNLAAATSTNSDTLWSLGRIRESIASWEVATESMRKASSGGAQLRFARVQYLANLSRRYAEVGDFAAVDKIRAEMIEQTRTLRAALPKGNLLPDGAQRITNSIAARVANIRGNPKEALRLVRETLPGLEAVPVDTGGTERDMGLFQWNDIAATASLDLGDVAASEKYTRAAIDARKRVQNGSNFDAFEVDLLTSKLAVTLLAQNRREEATKLIEPVVARRRETESRNHGDQDVLSGLIVALYVQGLVDPRRRDQLLNEAATLISGMPKEYRNITSMRKVSDYISDAQLGVMPWHRVRR